MNYKKHLAVFKSNARVTSKLAPFGLISAISPVECHTTSRSNQHGSVASSAWRGRKLSVYKHVFTHCCHTPNATPPPRYVESPL